MQIPLEDRYEDVLGKAIRGQRLEEDAVAAKAKISNEQMRAALGGEFVEPVARRLAGVLGLGADALVTLAKGTWRPNPVSLEGLAQFNTLFRDMGVNSYVVWDKATGEAVCFDSGSDAAPMIAHIRDNKLKLTRVLLTHSHVDHIADLPKLKQAFGDIPVHLHKNETHEGAKGFEEGETFQCGSLKIETRLTTGHSPGGVTYVVSGLSRPVAIVGDALFAGSAGGIRNDYTGSLRLIREKILTLPDETVVCPGHGPMTTVGEEKRNNPYFAV